MAHHDGRDASLRVNLFFVFQEQSDTPSFAGVSDIQSRGGTVFSMQKDPAMADSLNDEKQALNKQMITAIRNGDAVEVGRCLAAGVDPSYHHLADTSSWIEVAVLEARTTSEVLRTLLEGGHEIDGPDSIHNRTPLGHCCMWPRSEFALLLLEHGANVHAVDRHGLTPLHGACVSGSYDVAEQLLSRGANPDARDKKGETPRREATKRWKPEDVMRIFGAAQVDEVAELTKDCTAAQRAWVYDFDTYFRHLATMPLRGKVSLIVLSWQDEDGEKEFNWYACATGDAAEGERTAKQGWPGIDEHTLDQRFQTTGKTLTKAAMAKVAKVLPNLRSWQGFPKESKLFLCQQHHDGGTSVWIGLP